MRGGQLLEYWQDLAESRAAERDRLAEALDILRWNPGVDCWCDHRPVPDDPDWHTVDCRDVQGLAASSRGGTARCAQCGGPMDALGVEIEVKTCATCAGPAWGGTEGDTDA